VSPATRPIALRRSAANRVYFPLCTRRNRAVIVRVMKISTLILAFASFVLSPAVVADGTASSLREMFDPALQVRLERTLDRLGLTKAANHGELSVALVDLSNDDDPRLASVNGDKMMYAASLPKIAILLGAFVSAERGRLTLDAPTHKSLVRMIRFSSNEDATRLLNRVGRSELIDILTSDRFRLYDRSVGGGLWVGKEYGKAPAYQRDPLHNLSHGATAIQTARFYYLLEHGDLASPSASADMKRILGKPGLSHKFVKGLADVGPVRIFRKSGTWKQWHSDSALIEAPGHKYILVGLAKNKRGGGWLESLAREVHSLIVPQRIATR
jgi:beta-lactamase class A